MAEAVIVATARSPIGRAFKGSLVDVRPDDLLTQVIQALLDDAPALDDTAIDDLYVGAWNQSGEQAENLARRVAVQLGFDRLPAVMVNRACASSVQTARMAANAIRAGDGDVFISAGVESISRYVQQTAVGSGDAACRIRYFMPRRKSRADIWSRARCGTTPAARVSCRTST